jgi:hypothetical protein
MLDALERRGASDALAHYPPIPRAADGPRTKADATWRPTSGKDRRTTLAKANVASERKARRALGDAISGESRSSATLSEGL